MNRPIGAVPFRPDYTARSTSAVYVERAIIASVLAAIEEGQRGAVKIAKATWPTDEVTPLILKAASAPADTTTTGWAKELAPTMVADFVTSLVPLSAAAKLINAGIRITLTGRQAVNILKRSTAKPATDVAWVAEGQPIPQKQYTLNNVALGPTQKLPLLVGITRELAEFGGGQEVITTLVREDLAASLDASLFSTTAADTTRHAGILNGISPIAAATASPNIVEVGDLANIGAAIGVAGGGGRVVYIVNPTQMSSADARLLTKATIWPSAGVPAGTVIGIDPGAFASTFGPEPKISTSMQATIVERTDPTAIRKQPGHNHDCTIRSTCKAGNRGCKPAAP